MIHVDRSRVAPPALLSAPRQAPAHEFDFQTVIWKGPQVREALGRLFHHKCAYCDAVVGGEPHVEHFRPKGGAMDLHGNRDRLHYYWLAYEWSNLLPSCLECNRLKGPRFPVVGRRLAVGAAGSELSTERPLLLDPCLDDPEAHLTYLDDGRVVSATLRGQTTIEILGLNRLSLVEGRKDVLGRLGAFSEIVDLMPSEESKLPLLERQLQPEREFLAVRRQFFRSWIKKQTAFSDVSLLLPIIDALWKTVPSPQRTEIQRIWESTTVRQQSYSIEASPEPETKEAYFSGAKRIERIEIRDFKGIEELDLTFPSLQSERESWMMLLGENGAGKSSVLQAVALALMGERHANQLGLDASRFLRRESPRKQGSVRVHVTNVGPIELTFARGSGHFRVRPRNPKVLLNAYGATRLLPRAAKRDSSDAKHIRIKNLFDPTHPLQDAEGWLSDPEAVSDEKFRDIAEAIVQLLMLPEDTRITREHGQVEVEVHGSRTSLQDLSDGYQSIVALLVDIAIGTSEYWPRLAEAEGIVLLGEIEVHLHPTWKISIVERLRRACPNLSFLVTTHDPLCLKGLELGEIVVLRRDEHNRIYAETDIPPVDHLRSDQLLTSFLFNLPSTRSSATGPMVARYSMLLGRETRNEAEQKEFEELRDQLSRQLSSAITPEQQRVEAAVKETLLRISDAQEDSGELRSDVALELRRQIAEILGQPETEP